MAAARHFLSSRPSPHGRQRQQGLLQEYPGEDPAGLRLSSRRLAAVMLMAFCLALVVRDGDGRFTYAHM
jgi:hypothetical protein